MTKPLVISIRLRLTRFGPCVLQFRTITTWFVTLRLHILVLINFDPMGFELISVSQEYLVGTEHWINIDSLLSKLIQYWFDGIFFYHQYANVTIRCNRRAEVEVGPRNVQITSISFIFPSLEHVPQHFPYRNNSGYTCVYISWWKGSLSSPRQNEPTWRCKTLAQSQVIDSRTHVIGPLEWQAGPRPASPQMSQEALR